MTTLPDLLLRCQQKKITRTAVLDLMRMGDFECLNLKQKTALVRLAQLSKLSKVFEGLVDDLFQTGDIRTVQTVTVLCREPEGELGEIFMYEVQPRAMQLDQPAHPWNRALCWVMWQILTTQAHAFFLLSHTPESRLMPLPKRIANVTPAQLEAKQRAVNFLLKNAYVNRQSELLKLHRELDCSPWKHIIIHTQTFSPEHQTVGYVRMTINLDQAEPQCEYVTRTIMAYSDITLPAMARAALYLQPEQEFLLLVDGIKAKKVVYSSVFVVSSTLLCIDDNGEAIYNKLVALV
jgi:hypothetical protein